MTRNSIGYFVGVYALAVTISGAIPLVAQAAVIVTPNSGYDGIFTVQYDSDFSLFSPTGLQASSTYCTASSTPNTADCDVSGSLSYGTWLAVNGTSTLSSDAYQYLASSTVDNLWATTLTDTGAVVSQSWPLVQYVGGFLMALFAIVLVIWGFTRAARAGQRIR